MKAVFVYIKKTACYKDFLILVNRSVLGQNIGIIYVEVMDKISSTVVKP